MTPRQKLRAIWALHSIGAPGDDRRLALLDSPHEYVRGWAVQLSLENGSASPEILAKLAQLAATDPSPVVQLYLASGLQRLPLERRWPIAEALVTYADDAADQNIPLMLWYGIEPLVPSDREGAPELLLKCRIPLVREYIARRIAQ